MRWFPIPVVGCLIVLLAVVGCGDSKSSGSSGGQTTAPASGGGMAPSNADPNAGGLPGTSQIIKAQWTEAKTMAAGLVQQILTTAIGGDLSDALQVGRTADEFCPEMGIPVPNGEYFRGPNFRVSAVDHAAGTFTITITRAGIPGEMTVNERRRFSGP